MHAEGVKSPEKSFCVYVPEREEVWLNSSMLIPYWEKNDILTVHFQI
jgi:hypothetical protein